MLNSKKITITDVAHHAGVSITTVSLVLSGKGRISTKTITRVNRAVADLGFVRNRHASKMRGGESGVVGLIVRDICEPFYAEITAGASELIEAQGKVLFLLQSGPTELGLNRSVDTLLNHGVDGIIIAGCDHVPKVILEKTDRAEIPIIYAGRSAGIGCLDVVRADNINAAKMATEYLIKKGHKHIAYLGGRSHSLTLAERLSGFCASLFQYSLPFRSEWIIEGDYPHKEAADATMSLLSLYPQISAILCHTPSTVMGAYLGLMKLGFNVGVDAIGNLFERKVALIGMEDAPQLGLTAVASPAREIAYATARRLLLRIEGQSFAAENIIVGSALIERGSA